MIKRIILLLLIPALLAVSLPGCGRSRRAEEEQSAESEGLKTFVLGDTTFNAENGEPDINPHNSNSGWACIRYGVGETLFRLNDQMEIEPWLAAGYENVDELTWKITLRAGITFTSGRSLDGEAVKECLEALIENHARAAGDRSGHGSFCPTCRERQGSESWMWGADAAFSPCFWQRADIM